MGAAWRYWTHVRLEASGQLHKQEISQIKVFFNQQFPELSEEAADAAVPDLLIQRKLVAIMQSGQAVDEEAADVITNMATDIDEAITEPSSQSSSQQFSQRSSQLAAGCLRCFVSQQIPEECASLERRFGAKGGFSRRDLYSSVLDDVDPLSPIQVTRPKDDQKFYQPFAVKIVVSFNPQQSNLSTWTKRLVVQHKGLNAVLAESGIYLASDWAILSHTTPARIQRLLAGSLSTEELEQICLVLESYHEIYRGDRLRQESKQAGKRCEEPTAEQLQRMVQYLRNKYLENQTLEDQNPENQWVYSYSTKQVLRDLRGLAQKLRQVKQSPTVSLDDENIGFLVDQQQSQTTDEQEQFLTHYRQKFEQCLVQAIQQALKNRLAYLRRQKSRNNPALSKDQAFLQALSLFCCENKSMTVIAPLVGLQKEFQVSRLLDLKELRADVRRWWLLLLFDQLPGVLIDYLNQNQLQQLTQLQQLDRLLDDLLEILIQTSGVANLKPARLEVRQQWLLLICQWSVQSFKFTEPTELLEPLFCELLEELLQICRAFGLKTIRDEVRQTLLQRIAIQLPPLLTSAQLSRLPFHQLQEFDQLLDSLLKEQIDQAIEADVTASYNPHRQSKSLFTASLCQCLKSWSF